ncbi:MAG TPA: hypothetical protein VG965_00625 [Patescibacteria group bacterium]|nr:hypothetical protein [Patescibacteria group bacterium]
MQIFCSLEIASYLGSTKKGKRIRNFTAANGEEFATYKESFALHVGGKKYLCGFNVAEKLPKETPIILGQVGFFDHHVITFDIENKEITIVNNQDN